MEEIVHIIPLGHEFDRVVKPFEKLKANRAYLLSILRIKGIPYITDEMSEKQQYFLERVKKALEEKGIEVVVKHTNIFDILETMKNVSGIIRREKERDNLVYVNISGAGRLTSVAAALAAMAHGAKPYYVIADRYSKTEEEELQHGLSICEEPKIMYIMNFKISLPDEISLHILAKLCKQGKGMKTDEIIDFLRKELKLEEFGESKLVRKHDERSIKQILLNKLNRKFLDKMEYAGYIERERVGKRNTIRITETGRYIAHISGLLDIEQQ